MIGVGGAIAWALAGWRNMPRLEHPQAAAAGFMVAVSVWLAYWAGTRTQRSKAVAAAVARAEAAALAVAQGGAAASDARAQVVVINNPVAGGRHAAEAAVGLDAAPWLIGAHRAIDLDETEALQVAWEDITEPEPN